MPRIFSPGPKLDGSGGLAGDNWIVTSPGDARRAVDRLRGMGVDFIKVHNRLSRAVYDAIADQSRKDGLWFAGHATGEFGPMIAVSAGQRTIEHGRGMLPCSPSEREQVASDERLSTLCAPAAVADQILPAMARAGTWFTPTLVSWRGQGLRRNDATHLDGARYVSPALERRWLEGEEDEPAGALERQLLARLGPLTASAARAGVALLTGSDAGDPFVVPGFALHDELQLFVAAGVSPLQAIRSATLEPARALGVADRMGSIAPGKAADVVLLEADPLADIRNTRRIVAVVLDGRWLAVEQLAALLQPLHRPD
jgi:imidazolonepropionase-like amidohydrolase